MTRLILTADDSSAGAIQAGGVGDLVLPILRRFVSGPLPSDLELSAYLARDSSQKQAGHWLDLASRRSLAPFGGRRQSFRQLVDRLDTVELWMDSRPNDQLVLIWLLDHLHEHLELASKIVLRHVDTPLFDALPEQLTAGTFGGTQLTPEHLDIAHLAWQAFRAPTPRPWFNLLQQDLSAFPQLRRSVVEMLDELPGVTSGLGASELRILELLSPGDRHPFDLFPHHRERFQRRVYNYWETGALLEQLALAPVPAINGLAEWPFTLDLHDSLERFDHYKASTLSLTPFGKAILAGEEDFSRHNPIHRWWGGTELTNNNLWRWSMALVTPGSDTPLLECREPEHVGELIEPA